LRHAVDMADLGRIIERRREGAERTGLLALRIDADAGGGPSRARAVRVVGRDAHVGRRAFRRRIGGELLARVAEPTGDLVRARDGRARHRVERRRAARRRDRRARRARAAHAATALAHAWRIAAHKNVGRRACLHAVVADAISRDAAGVAVRKAAVASHAASLAARARFASDVADGGERREARRSRAGGTRLDAARRRARQMRRHRRAAGRALGVVRCGCARRHTLLANAGRGRAAELLADVAVEALENVGASDDGTHRVDAAAGRRARGNASACGADAAQATRRGAAAAVERADARRALVAHRTSLTIRFQWDAAAAISKTNVHAATTRHASHIAHGVANQQPRNRVAGHTTARDRAKR